LKDLFNIEEKLGFDKIRELLNLYSKTDLGKEILNKMTFSNHYTSIEKSLTQISEIGLLKQAGFLPEFPEFLSEISHFLSRLDKDGALLYEDELLVLWHALQSFELNRSFIQENQQLAPLFFASQKHLTDLKPAIQLIEKVIDKEGQIKPNASVLLMDISRQISEKERDVRKVLLSKFELAKKNGWAGDTEITIRNERLVIPIIAEHKRKINGFVHDDSQSGKYLYIEPIECFEENNLLKELFIEKKKEIERILKTLCRDLSPHREGIWKHIQQTAFLDQTIAKYQLSVQIKSIAPEYVKLSSDVRLIKARHPVLYVQLQKDNKKMVPLDFQASADQFLTLISGPNAGGKSIALKTIGLLQYMFQCGLPVPVDAGSRMTIFDKIFIDIGDNQSIENNLSSYSSHLLNMKNFMEHITEKSLYLIDEIGNGTDPSIGSSIAQAILEQFLKRKAFGVVTTHYGELKAWANATEGVVNARMLYDLKHLEPLFELEIGKPGSSFALEVASKVGLTKSIVERVRNISQWKQHIDLEELMAENEKNKMALADNNKRLADREKVLEKMISEYQTLKEDLLDNKKSILNEAKAKASDILNIANQEIEKTIKDIKTAQADKHKTKAARLKLTKIKEGHQKELLEVNETKPKKQVKLPELKPGVKVKRIDSKVSGEVVSVKGKQVQVIFGNITMWLPIDQLEGSFKEPEKMLKSNPFSQKMVEKQTEFRTEIDLRGTRGEEALLRLESWLEDAHLLGMTSLRIIHGRGYGILRKLILELLKKLNYVQSYEFESEQLGGNGVTIVKLK
jgi:DNA mismatch repair protein MutS2